MKSKETVAPERCVWKVGWPYDDVRRGCNGGGGIKVPSLALADYGVGVQLEQNADGWRFCPYCGRPLSMPLD